MDQIINFLSNREALHKKKEELHAEKHKSRLDRRITFDFAGRKVVEEEGAPHYDFEQVCNQFLDLPLFQLALILTFHL